ncbi:MYO3A protein, partial [Polypterus senegalus]
MKTREHFQLQGIACWKHFQVIPKSHKVLVTLMYPYKIAPLDYNSQRFLQVFEWVQKLKDAAIYWVRSAYSLDMESPSDLYIALTSCMIKEMGPIWAGTADHVAYRGYKVRKDHPQEKNKIKMEKFITQLQAVCRGYLYRKQYGEMVDEKNKAAVKIQACYRGHKDRRSYRRKKETMLKEEESRKAKTDEVSSCDTNIIENGVYETHVNEDEDAKAAVVIQSNYRGYRERKRFKERHQNYNISLEDATSVTEEASERIADVAEDNDQTDNSEEEVKAATVIQSNFRGHRERKKLEEEGKIPCRSKKLSQKSTLENSVNSGSEASEINGQVEDETKAAVVIQSNYRGHKERKRLQEEGKIPNKKYKEPIERDSDEQTTKEDSPTELDEDKAATVIQSNYRGQQERKRLKEQKEMGQRQGTASVAQTSVKQPSASEDEGPQQYHEEEQAAVKIQSNYRGYKDRKHLKEGAEREGQELARFSRQITHFSENYLALQQKLNEIILARQLKPLNHGVYVKEKQMNGYPKHQPQGVAEMLRAQTLELSSRPLVVATDPHQVEVLSSNSVAPM